MTDRQLQNFPTKRRKLASSSSTPTYDVFITHAGEDKATIAIPLRQKLAAHGISAFVDEEDMQPGTSATRAMTDAMETAKLAVVVLSPEFVSRKWPMRELMCFLRRYEAEEGSDAVRPVIIPFFYRLNVAELYEEPNLKRKDDKGRKLYIKSRFSERMNAGEPEADVNKVKEALRKLHDIMGVRNYVNAMNDSTLEMSQRREVLLEKLRTEVVKAMPQESRHAESLPTPQESESSSEARDQFRKSFPPLSFSIPAVLDFDGRDENNNPIKPEGWAKQHLLHQTSDDSRVVAIHGIGGVGKSTILQALATDEDIRREFSDGVHVMKLGQDATKTKLFEEICGVLKASGAEKREQCLRKRNEVDEALDEIERWFEKRHCAFLIDDAWTRGIEKRAFSRICKIAYAKGRNSILITTRENEIASVAPSSRTIHMEARDIRGRDSREILFFHADYVQGSVMSKTAEKAINGILDTCRGLPVGLCVAGKNVKNVKIGMSDADEAWKIYHSRMTFYPSMLWETELDQYRGLFTTFATSLESLDERRSRSTMCLDTKLAFNEMYRRLCVLPKHEVVPCTVLKYLWKTGSIAQAEIIATYFIEMGLARREVCIWVGEDRDWGLSLHDSLHDFAVTEADRHKETREAHEIVLVGYSSCDEEVCSELSGTRKWWSRALVEDGYFHRNLCRHLQGAGREKEVVSLLMMPAWGARQLEINGILSLQDDFSIGIKATQEGPFDENATRQIDMERTLRAISESFSMSWAFACSENRRELWFQVHGRLIGLAAEVMGIREYLQRITEQEERPWLRSANPVLSGVGSVKGKIIPVGLRIWGMLVMNGSERVLCGCEDGWIVVVNLTKGEIEEEWKAHEAGLVYISIARNGSRLISVSGKSKRAMVWDIESHRCVATFEGHDSSVNCVAVLGDGNRVVTGGSDNVAHVWEVETGQLAAEPFGGHDEPVTCVAVMEDGDHVVTGGEDNVLRLWNTKSSTEVGEPFVGHEDSVTHVTVSPDGKYLVSASKDETVRIWDIRSREQLGEPLKAYVGPFGGLSVARDRTRIVLGSNNTIRVWETESRKEACDPLDGHASFVTGVSCLTNRDSIVSCSLDGTVRLWNLRQKNAGRVDSRHHKEVERVAFTPDGLRVMSGSEDTTLRLWNVMSGQQNGNPLRGHDHAVLDIAIMPDGRRVVSVSRDQTVRVWDIESRKILHELSGHTRNIHCVALTPEGDYAVTGSYDDTVRVWDMMTMDSSHSVVVDSFQNCERLFVSDDGKRVFCVNLYGSVLVVDRETRQQITFKKYVEDAHCMSRKQIMDLVGETTVHDDAGLEIPLNQHRIRYGDENDNEALATLESDIRSWALSPDKKTLCVGLWDGQVGFFKLENV